MPFTFTPNGVLTPPGGGRQITKVGDNGPVIQPGFRGDHTARRGRRGHFHQGILLASD